jgi:hypothetical protein
LLFIHDNYELWNEDYSSFFISYDANVFMDEEEIKLTFNELIIYLKNDLKNLFNEFIQIEHSPAPFGITGLVHWKVFRPQK